MPSNLTVSSHFNLDKSQAELDFVDVPIFSDLPVFIDPFAISHRPDPWSQESAVSLRQFFQQIVDAIRRGEEEEALELLRFLREPNETHLGLSRGRPQGAGIGSLQARQLLEALSKSEAVRSGFMSALEESELMIPGIGRDKISDITTNVIRKHLGDYTAQQCELLSIPTTRVPIAPFYDRHENRWISDYFLLPVVNSRPLVLVPKIITRYSMAYDHRSYYRHFVLNFLQAEALESGGSLVRVLKSGKRLVTKKDVEYRFPLSKEFLFKFSQEHPEVLQDYREYLAELESRKDDPTSAEDQQNIANLLGEALRNIPPGGGAASDYHNLMIGVVEFIFFPDLLKPLKEREIHNGRKRIDILMENGAREGRSLHRLHNVKDLPCSYVPIECKNYRTEVANPELDQLAGRFSAVRGKLGILCCRQFEDRQLFVQRCQDTFRDSRGLIIPLDDATVLSLLDSIGAGRRKSIDEKMEELITEVWIS